MNIHEYQAKKILNMNGIKIPKGKIAYTPSEAKKAAKEVSDKGPWMLKAQIQSGARNSGHFVERNAGEQGGIRLVHSIKDVPIETEKMLGSTLVTKQTGPKGKFVSRVYVEAYRKTIQSFYAGMAIDRAASALILLVANTKDDDINTIVMSNPDKILRLPMNLLHGPSLNETSKIADFLKLSPRYHESFHQFITGMYKTFMNNDALMIEVNPAGVLKNGDVIALDAKITLDNNALYRHLEHKRLKDDTEIEERELKASKYGFKYYEFDGNVGCIVNGDGIGLTIMDLLKNTNRPDSNEAACILNVKGGVDREKITAGIKIIATNPKVEGILINILGGFVRCDLIADGIIDAAAEVGMNIPLVVRFEGTNRDEAKNILERADLPLIVATDMENSVAEIVKAIGESN